MTYINMGWSLGIASNHDVKILNNQRPSVFPRLNSLMKISNNDSNNSIPWHLALQRLLDLLLRVDHRIHPIQSSLTLPPSHQHCLSALVDLHCENRQYSPQGTRMYKLTASPEILQKEALKFCSEKSRILAPDFWPDRMWKCGHNALNFWGQLPQPIWGAFLGKYAVHITHLSTSFTTLDLGHPWSHWNILIETWSAVAVAVAVGPCCNSNAGAAQASPKRARSPSAAWHVTTGPKGKKNGSNMFKPSMTHDHNDQAKRLQEGAEECLKFCHTANKLPKKDESCDWHETKVLAQRKP